jgi:hypothetical protein
MFGASQNRGKREGNAAGRRNDHRSLATAQRNKLCQERDWIFAGNRMKANNHFGQKQSGGITFGQQGNGHRLRNRSDGTFFAIRFSTLLAAVHDGEHRGQELTHRDHRLQGISAGKAAYRVSVNASQFDLRQFWKRWLFLGGFIGATLVTLAASNTHPSTAVRKRQ